MHYGKHGRANPMKKVDIVFWGALITIALGFVILFIDGLMHAEAVEPEQPQEIACDSEPTVESETMTVQEFIDRARGAWENITNSTEEESEDESDGEYAEEYYEYQNWDYADYSGSQYYYTPSGYEATDLDDLLGWQGRANDGTTTYTWYPNDIGYGSIEGRIPDCHYDDNGVAYDGDGYIAVSADGYEMGEVIETPYGDAKVYDKGSGYGNIDVYTNR